MWAVSLFYLHYRDTSVVSTSSSSVTWLTCLGWSLWAKDIICLITEESEGGTQAWLDAYHGHHNPYYNFSSLSLTSGELQAAIGIEFPEPFTRFDSLSIKYQGTNGQLANLDLINTAIIIAAEHFGVPVNIQGLPGHLDGYWERLTTLFRGMVQQASGLGADQGAFIPYKVDAITLRANMSAAGNHDDIAFGR